MPCPSHFASLNTSPLTRTTLCDVSCGVQERPDLANLKGQLVISNAAMKSELKDVEDKILVMLSNSQGNILDDEELINTLAQSKVGHAPAYKPVQCLSVLAVMHGAERVGRQEVCTWPAGYIQRAGLPTICSLLRPHDVPKLKLTDPAAG